MEKNIKNDETTRKRWEYSFGNGVGDAHYFPLRITKKFQDKIEKDVQEWLDNNGAESPFISFELKPSHALPLTFWRSEISLKTCSNNWTIFHIAESSNWHRLISSKPKLNICHAGEHMQLKNEVRSFNYSDSETRESIIAQNLLDTKE